MKVIPCSGVSGLVHGIVKVDRAVGFTPRSFRPVEAKALEAVAMT